MIGYIKGKVVHVELDHAVIDVQGLGYSIFLSGHLLSELSLGREVELWISTHVREDAFDLFGFESLAAKKFFLSLLKVNGIGPRMAMHMLSGATLGQIKEWVDRSDVKALTALPKVGKKTAEQIILTLKGQLVLDDTRLGATVRTPRNDISSALINLGFRAPDVERVVDGLDPELTVEEGVRRGLQALTNV